MPTIDFSAPILDLEGNKLTEPERDANGVVKPGKTKVITLGAIACFALLNQHAGEERLGAVDKKARFMLAVRLTRPGKDGKISVDVKEAALILDVVAKCYPPLVYGRLDEALNGK